MRPTGQTWVDGETAASAAMEAPDRPSTMVDQSDDEDDDMYDEMPTVAKPSKTTDDASGEKDEKQIDENASFLSSNRTFIPGVDTIEEDGSGSESDAVEVDDKVKEPSVEAPGPIDGAKPNVEKELNPKEAAERLILETGRLFLRNLSYQITETELRRRFAHFGPLSAIHLPMTSTSNDASSTTNSIVRPKGYAYVLYLMPQHALAAWKALDGTDMMGRLLHILPAKPPSRAAVLDDGDASGKTLKAKKEAQRKARTDGQDWNPFYVRVRIYLYIPFLI